MKPRSVRTIRAHRSTILPVAAAVAAPTVLIMAAGEGTRMRSALPKVLHAVCGRPMIAWPVLAAREAGAGRVVVIVSPDRDLTPGLPEGTETVVQPEATAPAAPSAPRSTSSATPNTVIVLNGDHPLVSAEAIRELHRRPRARRRRARP